ncbi:MAG: UvrD-helicase domain-containing protein [Bacteroidota bacterium]
MSTQDQGLVIYKSSAGSGKTYTLVLEYLKIIILDPGSYRHILAVTFTNKATEEMKNRIISSLGTLATRELSYLKKTHYYQTLDEHLKNHIKEPKFSVQKQARTALNYILNDYSNFAVSTIESFFQRIVRAFARELNIPLGYDVEMRQDVVLDQIIAQTLLEVGQNKELTKLFIQFVSRNLSDEKGWNVDNEVKRIGGEIFKENFQNLVVNAGEEKLEIPVESLIKMAREVRSIREKFEKSMAQMAEDALDRIAKQGLILKDFKYGDKGVPGYFLNILRKQDYIPGKRAREAYDNPESWVAKTGPKREIALSAVQGGLQDYLNSAIDLYDQEYSLYNTAVQISRTIYSFGVLNNLREKLNDYRRDHTQLIISDTNFLLKEIVQHHYDHAPFIYEKVGTQFLYYLLDEFQDTSEMQWKNILPLLLEALAQGKKSLIVGDVKQAIYRWRNGDWKLLLEEVEKDIGQSGQVPAIESLQNNWRTAKEIVDFNNSFFIAAAKLLGEELGGDGKYQRAYHEVVQTARKTALPGLVDIRFFDKPKRGEEEAKSWKEKAMLDMLEELQQIKEDGFQFKDVTILVRRNFDGVQIAEFLQKHEIQVVSAESLLLISDPKVRLIQAMLQHLNHEEDAIAKASLAYSFQLLLREEETDHTWFSDIEENLSHMLLSEEKDRLRQFPVYACVEEILSIFPILKSPVNAYVQGFLDAVLEYASTQDSSISGFLEWWEQERTKRSIYAAPNPEAVQIMTIHKSKGLEFPIVMMPFADWDILPKDSGVLWVKPEEGPLKSFDFFPIHPNKRLISSAFSQAYQQELTDSKLDNLNVLYVAFTRAQYRLYVFSQSPSKSKKNDLFDAGIGHIHSLLHHTLLAMSPESMDDNQLLLGQKFHASKIKEKEDKDAPVSTALGVVENSLSNWGENIRVKYQINPDDPRPLDQDHAQLREGNLLHDALDFVIVEGDTEMAAHKMYLKGLVDIEERNRLKARLEDVVSHKDAKVWFDGSWTVKNEADIITGDGKLLRPDRVMLKGQEVVVVDYKTGLPSDYHQRQLARYIKVLKDMGYTDVKGYLYYLSLNSVDAVV